MPPRKIRALSRFGPQTGYEVCTTKYLTTLPRSGIFVHRTNVAPLRGCHCGCRAAARRRRGHVLNAILEKGSVPIMLRWKSIARLSLITAAILSVPLVAMQLSNEVDWSLFDFVLGGALIFGTGLAFELIAGKAGNTAYRAATGLALATGFLIIWINLAVGFIGSEDNPVNLLYLAVLCVGMISAFTSRLRPRGMARAMYATALTQALVPVLAIMIWKPPVTDEEALAGLVGVLFLNAVFVLLFVASGTLFRRADDSHPNPPLVQPEPESKRFSG